MTTLEFRFWDNDGKSTDLEINADAIVTCAELHDYCKRFATAMGYDHELIENTFGPTFDY